MVKIRSLSAGYPGKTVLRELSLDIPRGKVTVVVGPNGCGKSTFLKALAGILPARGQVLLEARDLLALPARERARLTGYLPQNRPVPEITARRLVLHGRFPYLSYPRQYSKEDLAIAEGALGSLGLLDLADRSLGSLSGGQRQKVYIAMLLAQDTPLVLLDEPNTFLDIGHQLQMMSLAKDLAARGKTVVLVLHDLPMALEQGDNLIVMETGKILTRGTPEEVFRSGTLDRTFGICVKRTQTDDGWKYYCKEM